MATPAVGTLQAHVSVATIAEFRLVVMTLIHTRPVQRDVVNSAAGSCLGSDSIAHPEVTPLVQKIHVRAAHHFHGSDTLFSISVRQIQAAEPVCEGVVPERQRRYRNKGRETGRDDWTV